MNTINYNSLSLEELRRYMLTHREDTHAFYAYMDRRHSRPNKVSIAYDDPEWETKIIEAIHLQMENSSNI